MPNNLLTYCKLKFVKQVSKTVFTLLCKCVTCLEPENATGNRYDCYLHINNNCNFIYINVVNNN
ncbi:nesp081 [Neophasia sp. alphabaculovirus]|nr:nesp081 [Neophasia sp. alphabaculovirus]